MVEVLGPFEVLPYYIHTFLSQVFIAANITELIRNRDYTQLAYGLISLIFIRNGVIDQ
jgi:hypothetical protein